MARRNYPDDESDGECGVVPTPPVPARRRYRELKERHFIEPSGAIKAEGLQNKHAKQLIREIRRVRNGNMSDPYVVGYHNGLQQALALLTGRAPNYIMIDRDTGKPRELRVIRTSNK